MNVILTPRDCDYSDMTDIGRVTVSYKDGRTDIVVDGFDFEEAQTCRVHCMRAMLWARDLLDSQIEIDRMMPGGTVYVATNMDQEGLEAELATP